MLKKINRVFDWKSYHDSRSKDYPIRAVLNKKRIVRKRVMWEEGVVLDQGSEGACVGFGWMADVLAAPKSPDRQPDVNFANRLANFYYKRAKEIDEWPGEDYDGTSVLAGAKVMQEQGFIEEYRWCFSTDDVRDAVISEGPVVIGIPWKKGMYSTLGNGLVQVTGPNVGGHCLTITGYDPAFKVGNQTFEVFRWRNSWGKGYGLDGSGYIKYTDLQRLLKDKGEACVPMKRSKPIFKSPWKQILLQRFLGK
jgi:C1A family cysteine protease